MQPYDKNISMMGNRLKDIMEREKISAYKLSKDLNLDKGHLSKFLNGKAEYSVKKLIIIAEYMGYDIEFVKKEALPERKVK